MADLAPTFVNQTIRDKIIACGGVPVIDDLEAHDAYPLLFEQLLGILACAGAGGGGIPGINVPGITPGDPVSIAGFNQVPRPAGFGTLAGVNPFAIPVPPALPFPGTAGTDIVLMGPAGPAFTAAFDPADIVSVTPAPGPFGPLSFGIDVVTAVTATGPTIIEFNFEGQDGIIVIDFLLV